VCMLHVACCMLHVVLVRTRVHVVCADGSDFLQLCMTVDPSARGRASALLACNWVRSLDDASACAGLRPLILATATTGAAVDDCIESGAQPILRMVTARTAEVCAHGAEQSAIAHA
jgi:hypothetical protein